MVKSMEESDRKKVIQILFHADHGCPYCVSKLLKEFIEVFPGHDEEIHATFVKKYKNDTLFDAEEIWNDA
jgi:transposase